MAKENAASLLPLVKSKIKARSALKGLSTQEIEKLIANFKSVLESEKKKEVDRVTAAKKARIAKIKALMDESGIQPDDLKASAGRRGRRKKAAGKKKKVAAKYRLVIDGNEHLWSGRGRPPQVFREYMDAGNSKESCAIS